MPFMASYVYTSQDPVSAIDEYALQMASIGDRMGVSVAGWQPKINVPSMLSTKHVSTNLHLAGLTLQVSAGNPDLHFGTATKDSCSAAKRTPSSRTATPRHYLPYTHSRRPA